MKRLISLTLIALLAVSLIGCTQSQPTVETVIETVLVEVPVTESPATQPTQIEEPANETNKEKITEQEAKDIAFKHAKVNSSDAKFVTTELDYDDGILRYEIDFHSGSYEYDYEIDAHTGSILSYDKDKEDIY